VEVFRRDTYGDEAVQSLAVHGRECVLDVSKVLLGAGNDDTDQRAVVSAQALHALVQTLSEEACFVLDAPH